MSFGVAHSMLFFFMLIQVASLGADQFNLGATRPPSEAIVSLISWWRVGKASEGSGSGSSSQSVEEEEGL